MIRTKLIPSEEQAERIGEKRTGRKRGEGFKVFSYVHKPSGLTVFGIEIKSGGSTSIITVQ